MTGGGTLPQWFTAGVVAAAVAALLMWLLPPLLREIVVVLLKACAIAVVAYAIFVALLIRH